jgi:predicted PurR-regulated permease PerM
LPADPFASVMETGMAEERQERARLADAAGGAERRPGAFMAPMVVGAVTIAGLFFARPVLEPLALAALLSLMLAPAVHWLNQHGLGRVQAVSLTLMVAFSLILGFAAAVGEEAIGFVKELPQYEQNITTKIRSLSGTVPGAGILGRATMVFRDLGSEFGSSSPAPGAAPVPVEIVNTEPASFQLLRNIVGPMLSPLASAGLVVVFAIMILLKREDLRDRVLRLAGARDLHRTTAAMNEAAERVSRYLLMQLGVGICYGLPVGIGLALIGIPNPLLWGMLGMVMRFVPYIGGPLTAVLPVALAIAVAPGWDLLLWTILLFAAAELVIANVVEPWAYSRTTGLSAVAVVAAAAFWIWLWGIVGLLLATPLTVCLVVLGRYVPQLQFLDILLGNRPVLSSQQTLYQRLLAQDPEEAAEQAEEFARDKSIGTFFDEVAVPALALAQADSDRGALGGNRRAAIAEGFGAMLDNLVEEGLVEPGEPVEGTATVVCIAGRNELDLAAAWLLQHLLRLRGIGFTVMSPDALNGFNLDRLPRGISVICLSLLSTGSAARARYLVRRIRRRARRATIVIGFWGQTGAEFSIDEAIAATAADKVVITLVAAVAEIEAALGPARGSHSPPALRPPPSPVVRERV